MNFDPALFSIMQHNDKITVIQYRRETLLNNKLSTVRDVSDNHTKKYIRESLARCFFFFLFFLPVDEFLTARLSVQTKPS